MFDRIDSHALLFEGGGGTEVIYSAGNNIVGFASDTVVSGGALSHLTPH